MKRQLCMLLCVVGCQDPATVGDNELGIVTLDVDHQTSQGDRMLVVRGFDAVGAEIATATLRTGTVMYGGDLAAEPHDGTELVVTVDGASSSFVSPDRAPHAIFDPLAPSVASFVALPAVAAALVDEAGITFAPPHHTGEIALSGTQCSGNRFPTKNGNSSSCCQDNPYSFHINGNNDVANRYTYVPAWPSIPVCRKSDGTTGCTGSGCLYGPCGSAIATVGNTGHGKVFHPTTGDSVCGWDKDTWTTAGTLNTDFYPENCVDADHNGSCDDARQTAWTGVTASCPYSNCKSDGSPGLTLALTVTCENDRASGTVAGSVTWNGNTVSCSAPAFSETTNTINVWYPYNSAQTLTHSSSVYWNSWAGPTGCNGAGTCSGTWLGTNGTVSVSGFFWGT